MRLTDAQERALIALDESDGWQLAREVRCGIVPGGRFQYASWYRLKRLGFVEMHGAGILALEVRITDAGRALLRSMGD